MVGGIMLCLLVTAFAYLFYFRTYFEEKRNILIFNNRVLSVIDGLYLAGVNLGCTDFEMRSYAKDLLAKAHALPGNEMLLEHTVIDSGIPAIDGFTFRSHIGTHGGHITFALLCIIDRAKKYDKISVVHHCERLLLEAQSMESHY